MGTRSVIAMPNGDGWKGRYCHWDGSPESQLPQLQAIIARDGCEAALKVLTEDHYGWSSLDHDRPADHVLEAGHDDGRFVSVTGYGTAYTTAQDQSSPDDWVTSDGDDWGTEYAYVVNERAIVVLENEYGSGWRIIDTMPHAGMVSA